MVKMNEKQIAYLIRDVFHHGFGEGAEQGSDYEQNGPEREWIHHTTTS